MIHYYAFIVCLPLCSKLYICDSDIYVIVIYDMCALYFELFICHITCVMLICLCFRVLLRCRWALLLVLMLILYPLSTSCWLGSYKLASLFCSYWQKLIWTKLVKNLTLSHTRGGIVINHRNPTRGLDAFNLPLFGDDENTTSSMWKSEVFDGLGSYKLLSIRTKVLVKLIWPNPTQCTQRIWIKHEYK